MTSVAARARLGILLVVLYAIVLGGLAGVLLVVGVYVFGGAL